MGIVNRLLRRPGTGCLLNPPDKRDWDFSNMKLAGKPPAEYSIWHLVKSIYSQGGRSSCTGNAVALATTIREVAAGYPWQPKSALDAYWYGRFLDGLHKTDGGAHIRSVVKAMSKRGLCDEQYWPPTKGVNKQPHPVAQMQAHPRQGGKYVTIRSLGTAKADAIKVALAADYPVIFAAKIDGIFGQRRGPLIIDKPLDPRWWHAMVFTGYKVDSDFGLVFEFGNSYSNGWRDGGRAWMTEAYVRSALVTDLTICYGWKRIR
jgi:hypothetical protein